MNVMDAWKIGIGYEKENNYWTSTPMRTILWYIQLV